MTREEIREAIVKWKEHAKTEKLKSGIAYFIEASEFLLSKLELEKEESCKWSYRCGIAEGRLMQAREVLEWYADKNNYVGGPGKSEYSIKDCDCSERGGKRARALLEKWK